MNSLKTNCICRSQVHHELHHVELQLMIGVVMNKVQRVLQVVNALLESTTDRPQLKKLIFESLKDFIAASQKLFQVYLYTPSIASLIEFTCDIHRHDKTRVGYIFECIEWFHERTQQ